MKQTTKLLAASVLLMITHANAAISLVNDNNMSITFDQGTVSTIPTATANIYWDADTDAIFGETGIGENSGNDNTSLDFTISSITSGTSYHFGFEGFGGLTGAQANFVIENTDASTQTVNVADGATTSFSDSDGTQWEVTYAHNANAYGDVVFNLGTGGNGINVSDHQAVLTFTTVPEPSSTMLLGLGGIALILHRRK